MNLLTRKADIRGLIHARERAEQELKDARDKRDQETKSLKAERQQARTAAAVSLVTGGDSPPVPALPDEAKLDEKEVRLALAVQEAEKAVEAAKLAEWESLQKGIPGLAKRLKWACRVEREALAAVGAVSLKPYATLLKAKVARTEAQEEVYAVQQALKRTNEGDPRVNAAQVAALNHIGRESRMDATPVEIAGFFVAWGLAYSRASNSPLEEYWAGEGVWTGGDSILHCGAMDPENIHKLLEGNLP